MTTDVIMPQMGESIFEGTITRWLKNPGDAVEKDEPLFEISTDKVDAEIPSPKAGVLKEIKVPAGATVQVNTVVAIVSENGSTADRSSVPQVQPTLSQPSGTNVVMPQMGESIFEGTITRWLKNPGDLVEKDEPLFEISTDKVDAEIPAPVAGVLTAIKAPAGATVQINTVVAVIGGSTAEAVAVAEPAVQVAASPVVAAEPTAPRPDGRGLRSSPLVRRIAREHNLDLAQVRGTGSQGRITKEDILLYLSRSSSGSTSRQAGPGATPQGKMEGKLVEISKMRSIIAQRMLESVHTSPHAYTVYKIDMTRIARLREKEKVRFEKRHGVKLTFMPFIAAATVEALRKYPIVNAGLEGNSIRYHQNIHLGIAVALEWGLIVPVVREAEQRDFLSLSRAIADLAERARTKKLKPDEASGSTITLTNSGVFGGEFGTPILNQPESAILAIGGLKKEPVVLTDADGNESIAIRAMQHYCLGFDHRIIDGADAGKFMQQLKHTLEFWDKPIG